MLPDPSGAKPKLGSATGAPGLGVRVAPDPIPDVFPDAAGNVEAVNPPRGMSVAPALAALPARLIPKRLQNRFRKARGEDNQIVWSMGDGPFSDGPVAESLRMRVTSPTHGVVEPDAKMPLIEFQNRLAGTQNLWRKDEE